MSSTNDLSNNITQGPNKIKSVCVFCGSKDGADPIYVQEATEIGKILAENNIRLVYGGGSIGVMGAVAKATLDNGGDVLAVVPEPLFTHGSKQIAKAVVVPDMHTRKKRMAEESDAFVVLPGGFGTMEEMLEMITWSQLNIHNKPIVLLNTKNYYKLFVDWIKMCITENFIRDTNTDIYVVCDTTKEVLHALQTYQPPKSRYEFDWTPKERESLV
ncbi:hypothetical protein EDC96DRAFT_499048 [Choanephora cucurbitarum]|nr:hypothetical protein EDC96DRAFT_499048 [Choanephora cucurbitarum]